MTPEEGRALRRERLRVLLERHGLAAILLRRADNVAWYTGGADTRVDRSVAAGVADVLVTADAEWVVAGSIEAPRMRLEQTPDLAVVEFTWHDGPERTLRELAGGGPVGIDLPLPGLRSVAEDVDRLRSVLDEDAIDRLRSVGEDTVAAVLDASTRIVPGTSERDAAAELAAACRRRGLTAPVLLAAADERIVAHRHPIPAGATIERRAMLVVSAERGGLFANVTRIVWLDDPLPGLVAREASCDEILTRMREEATLPGRTLAEAFSDCRRFYEEAGFPGEERLHHQGGTTGYRSREVIATPTTDDRIVAGNAFAWNPSITGAKAEETFVLTDAGAEVVANAGSRVGGSDRAAA